MRHILHAITLTVVLCIALEASADVPWVLNFSGRLGSEAGDYTGIADVTVTLYDHVDSFDAEHVLWTDIYDVYVGGGRFHLLLGQDPSNPIPPELLMTDEAYVGVAVGEDAEMVPRMRIVSVPFAMSASDANALQGLGPDAFSAFDHSHDYDDTYVNEGQAGSVDGAMVLDRSLTLVDLGDSGCGDGEVAKWDPGSNSWVCAPDLDTDTDTTYTAGTGLVLTGTVFSAPNAPNWDTAYGWGDHSTAGYLTSYTETDPVFQTSAAYGVNGGDITNWDTSYGWGDHSTQGYLTSYTETDPQVGGNIQNYLPRWSGSALVTGTVYDDGVNVGIGTTNVVTHRLNVNGTISATGGTSTLWNTAYGWGDHSTEGYLTSFSETDPQVGANTTGYLARWNGSALISGAIYDNGTSVGIGTTNVSSHRLNVNGTISATGGNSSQWNTAVADSYKWDGGSTGLNASTGRTSLGLGTLSTLDAGNGLSVGSGKVHLGNLTQDWNQSGPYDINLSSSSSEISIRESIGGSYYGTLDVGNLGSNQTYIFQNGGTVWTSGGDGAGSGLDADTLDGQHASYFSPSTHEHDSDYVDVGGDTMTGLLHMTGSSGEIRFDNASDYIITVDGDVDSGIYFNTTSNRWSWYWNGTQRGYMDLDNGDMHVVGDVTVGGSISGDGSGLTGVDADTVDGKSASEFASEVQLSGCEFNNSDATYEDVPNSWTNVTSIQMNTPSPGYVIVTFYGSARLGTDGYQFYLGIGQGATTTNKYVEVKEDAGNLIPFSVQYVYAVLTSTYTFYGNAWSMDGLSDVFYARMTAIFVPNRY